MTNHPNLRCGKIKYGVTYQGVFYEFGTIEYNNLMLIEGKKEENKGTLLDYFSQVTTENPDDIINKN